MGYMTWMCRPLAGKLTHGQLIHRFELACESIGYNRGEGSSDELHARKIELRAELINRLKEDRDYDKHRHFFKRIRDSERDRRFFNRILAVFMVGAGMTGLAGVLFFVWIVLKLLLYFGIL